MKTLLGNALRCIFTRVLLLQSIFSSAQCPNGWRAEYVGQIHRHCSICTQHSVLSFFSPCTVFCPLFPVQSLPCAQLALLGDKSGLTAMNTDSLLMCYNLFWFAAQHSPSASSHSNANDDDDDGEAEDEDDKSEDVATTEIVNPIGTKVNQIFFLGHPIGNGLKR